MLCEIMLEGCDGENVIQTIVSKDQYEFFLKIAKELNKQCESQCIPSLHISNMDDGCDSENFDRHNCEACSFKP